MTAVGTLRGLLEAGTDHAPAIVSGDGTVLTHAGLRAEVDRLADRLRSLGLGPADRIAIVVPNGPEMALAFLAAACAGCAAPLNPKYRLEELRFYLDDLGTRALITLPDDSGSVAREAARASGAGVLPVSLAGSVAAGPGAVDLTAEPTLGGVPAPDRPTADDVALVLHTSGTTSRPKIVPLRQRNLARSAAGIAESLALTHRDRSLQGHAAVPHPRAAGRAAGAGCRRGERSPAPRASTPSGSSASSKPFSPATTPRCRPCIRWSSPVRAATAMRPGPPGCAS